MEKRENPQQTSVYRVSSAKDQHQRFYLYPIINLLAVGFRERDGIPSNLGDIWGQNFLPIPR